MRGESTRVAARVRDLLSEHVDRTGRIASEDPGPPGEPLPARPGWRQQLQVRIPVRLDPGRRSALAVGAAVLVAAILTGLWVVTERPRALAVGPSSLPGASSPLATGPPASGSTATSAVASSAAASAGSSGSGPSAVASTVVVVDVAGKVRRPGLYRLPVGARVDDAVRAAGGALAGVNLNSLNLAAKVVDGQQIPVGIPGSAGGVAAGPNGSGGAAGAGSGAARSAGGAGPPVDLNAATAEQLETLPGVGPVLAQHVLDWRTAHGRFATVDQLNDVPGIGEVKFAALKQLVTV